jgi:antitoxin component of RelBE/YafQ-DinJ toxin-antitoxin module
MIKQDEVIQIKVSGVMKKLLTKIAEQRGLPLSTFIKYVLFEYLKKDNLWEDLETKEVQDSIVQKFIEEINK